MTATAPGNQETSGRGIRFRRIAWAIALVALIGAGLGVHALLPDTHATDIAGDALYAAAVYSLVALLAAAWHPLAVGGVALAGCVGVELFQLTGIPLALGAVFPPAMLVLGTVFDPRDLLVYAVTVVLVTGTDAAARTVMLRRASAARPRTR